MEDVLKLVSEKKIPFGENLSEMLQDTAKSLNEFCEASDNETGFSLHKIRTLEARLLQLVWGATQSEERTHLFFGKYHLEAIEKFLIPLSGGKGFKITPESDFSKVIAEPCGSLVQFNGDRRGYASVLMSEETFSELLYPYISGVKSKRSAKQEAAALSEFARVMGNVGLAGWIEARCSFPCSMVDRIVPRTVLADRAQVSADLGADDAWPVIAEPFTDWEADDEVQA